MATLTDPRSARRRRMELEVEAQRRFRARQLRIVGDVRDARRRRGWTQAELGRAAGVERSRMSRIERAIGGLDLEVLERLCLALGLALAVNVSRDLQQDVADAGHLAIQELLLRLGRGAGFGRSVELATKPAEPWRSVDVALLSDARHVAICAECWNSIGDVGAAMRSSARKRAELVELAAAAWGVGARVGLVWVVRATRRNRDLVAKYPEVFAARFSGSSRAWVEALANGGPIPEAPGLVWCDVGSTRLFEWRRPGTRARAA